MRERGEESKKEEEIGSIVAPFDDEPDSSLIDEMLRMKISDRLRAMSRNANALRRFRPV